MARSKSGLLDQIEEGALDSKTPLADVLRKCVALGGRAGSDELRDWARRELDGYPNDADLPHYRVVPAVIAIDGANSAWHWKAHQLSSTSIPQFARDEIGQEVKLTQGVGELEKLAEQSDIRMQHPGMPTLVDYMNSRGDVVNGVIHRMYWFVSPNSIHGAVDAIRTTLVSLVAELRAAGVEDLPTAAAADQAVNVVVHNAKRSTIHVNANQASGESTADQSHAVHGSDEEEKRMLPAWVTGPWGFAVGLFTIVAGVAGLAVWLNWFPFGVG